MKYLNLLDCGIIIGYLIVVMGIGYYLKKRASTSLNDYFLGGRRLPWWLLGISGMSAWVDMTGTMIITSFLFMIGPRGLFVEFRGGAGLVLVFCMLWLGKWHRRSGCMTSAEWMKFRFGEGFGGNFARFAAVVSGIIFALGLLAYSMVGGGLFLSMFLPFPPWVCSLMLVAVTYLYTIQAGFYGVVIADIFQMSIFIFSAIFISIMALGQINQVDNFTALAGQVTGNSEWFSSVPSFHTDMPKGYEKYSPLFFITLFYFAKTFIQGLGNGAEPKYFAARNDRECGLLSFLCGNLMSIRWLFMMGFVILGIILIGNLFQDNSVFVSAVTLIKQEFPEIKQYQWADTLSSIINSPQNHPDLVSGLQSVLGDDWTRKLNLLSYHGTVDSERVLPAVLLYVIPGGVRGLIFTALVAAAMSTFASFINLTTALFTRDIYQNLIRPKAGNKELIRASYVFGFVLVAVAALMAYSSKNINDIWGWLMMGLSGGLIVPLALRLYWWRFNGVGFACGTVVGIIAAILQRYIAVIIPQWKAVSEMSEAQQFGFILIIGTVASVIGTYLAPPVKREILENFYLKTRPFGWWGPFKSLLKPQDRKTLKREHFFDITALPFAFIWQISILLLPLQLLIGNWFAFKVTLILLIISLVGLYYLWFKRLPAENFENFEPAGNNDLVSTLNERTEND
ncbi:MAG: sodium:solute symporter [Phycisphaerales bacterium]